MNQPTEALLPVGVGLRSSQIEIDTELRRIGVFRYPNEYVKDLHFRRHVFPLGLKTMADVHQFLDTLEVDNQKVFSPAGCQKAYVARSWMKHTPHSPIPELEWAIIGLARARRTCCGCHETGSFHLTKDIPGL